MPAALIWLIAALLLAGAEALTGDMFLLMLAGGALAAAVSRQLLDLSPWVDGAVFLVVSVLLVTLVRPTLRRRLQPAALPEVGIEALAGRSAIVLEPVSRHGGQIKLAGEVWSARPMVEHDVYGQGEEVSVIAIDGATAIVGPTGFGNSIEGSAT
ncbi:hypothetical protein MINS_24650 [Mycolicibacterium insubricum]|jgi:membrane protein implicated in regulation of membrane protease activity|uniref:NfeD-like C-terminal domain-containing protein n=1 Tax=Mycolicibacterium insubricum TaxID=444597 RepID=A0A1X0DFT7_9MYCO|nr:NfeD family protein [Mycolicibacterium insubricum]MCV7083569.1 NfeD family protein [Mycolicibacterium insubricum]ORA71042.1 hypothetical protein BST26_09180 [Mycolicibacterium insubricum]BBZ67036.1 hypothetical protein MINS_24650 [Mycolicibacterium insubricum]